jgi:hypothetical protein
MKILLKMHENVDKKNDLLTLAYYAKRKHEKPFFIQRYKKEVFSEQDIANILKLKTNHLKNQKLDLEISKNMNVDISKLGNFENIEVLKENKKTEIKEHRDPEIKTLTNNDINKEISHLNNESIIDMSCFLIKRLKKIFLSVKKYEKGNLIDTEILYFDNNIFNKENIENLLSKSKLINKEDSSKLYLRQPMNRTNVNLKILSEQMERILLKRVDFFEETPVGNKKLIEKTERIKLNKKRKSYLKELENPENVVIYTDGSNRFNCNSSAFILKHKNIEINRSYLFNHSFSEYEEVALLKSIEYVLNNNLLGKKIFIISDKEANQELIDLLISKKTVKIDDSKFYKNLFYKIKNKLNEVDHLDINFNSVKSHLNELKDIDFIYNAKVDEIAYNTIKYRNFISEDLKMTSSDLLRNELKAVDLVEPKRLYEIDKKEKLNDPILGFLVTEKSQRIASRNKRDKKTISLFINSKLINEKEHIRFTLKIPEKGNFIYYDFEINKDDDNIIYKHLSDFTENNIKENTKIEALRIFYDDERFKEIVRKDLANKITTRNTMFSLLAESHSIFEGCYNSEATYKTLAGDYRIVSEHNMFLKIDTPKKEKTRSDYRAINSSSVFPVKTVEINLGEDAFGNKEIFPAFESLEKLDLYLFFEKTSNGNIKITKIHRNKEESLVVKPEEKIQGLNQILKSKSFNIARNCIIITDNEETKEDIVATMNKEKNLDCNVVKIINKRFDLNKILIVEESKILSKINELKWLKERKTQKQNIKRKIG